MLYSYLHPCHKPGPNPPSEPQGRANTMLADLVGWYETKRQGRNRIRTVALELLSREGAKQVRDTWAGSMTRKLASALKT